MLRSIAGVIAGYLALAVALFIAFTVMYMIMGTEGAYKPGSWEVSTAWLVGALVIGFAVAVLGGFVCKLVSGRRRGAVIAMAVVIGALGVLDLLMRMNAEPPTEPRPAEVSTMDAAANARQPLWFSAVNLVVGITGTLIGGGVLGTRTPGSAD
jgi:hypothetical protein